MCAYVKIRIRRGTRSQWEYANPILSEGEIVAEVPDTGVGTGPINLKQGDGTTSYNNLPYAFNAATLNDKVDTLANTVATYDTAISSLTTIVEGMETKVEQIRRIDIQSSTPEDASDGPVGRIWIDNDIIRGSMALTPSIATMGIEEELRLTLTKSIDFSYDTIEWSVSPTGLVELSDRSADGCMVKALYAGTATVTASAIYNGSTIYKTKSTITVSAAGVITVSPTEARIVVGNDAELIADTSQLSILDTVEYTSSATYYATVDKVNNNKATIHAVATGVGTMATIYARAMVNGRIIATATCEVTTIGMSLNKASTTITVDDTDSVLLTNTMEQGVDYDTITWASSDPTIATVNGNASGATITGNYTGRCNITVTAYKERAGFEPTVVQTLTLIVEVKGYLKLEPKTLDLVVGKSDGMINVTNKLGGSYDPPLEWIVSDESVVRKVTASDATIVLQAVNADGVAVVTVNGKKNGTIIATDTAIVRTTGTMEIHVHGQTTVTNPTITVGSDLIFDLMNTLNSDSYNTIDWGTQDATKVSIVTSDNTSCTVRGLAAGSSIITARALNTYTDPETGTTTTETVMETQVTVTVENP